MDLDLEVRAVSNSTLFAGVDPAKLRLLACMSEQLRFDQGEYLFRMGDPSGSAYVILSGKVDLVVDGEDGPKTLATHGAGALIGEIGVLCGGTRIASAQAATPVAAMHIGKDCLLRMMQDNAQFSLAVSRQLAKRMMDLIKRDHIAQSQLTAAT